MKYQVDNFASYRVLPKESFALFPAKSLVLKVSNKVFYFGPKAPFCGGSFIMHQTNLWPTWIGKQISSNLKHWWRNFQFSFLHSLWIFSEQIYCQLTINTPSVKNAKLSNQVKAWEASCKTIHNSAKDLLKILPKIVTINMWAPSRLLFWPGQSFASLWLHLSQLHQQQAGLCVKWFFSLFIGHNFIWNSLTWCSIEIFSPIIAFLISVSTTHRCRPDRLEEKLSDRICISLLCFCFAICCQIRTKNARLANWIPSSALIQSSQLTFEGCNVNICLMIAKFSH